MRRIAFDSNLLVYNAGLKRVPGDSRKIDEARRVTLRLAEVARIIVPAQAVAEVYNVLSGKGRWPREAAREYAEAIGGEIVATTPTILADALDLAATHRLQIWDAIILAASASAAADFLLSEDMQAGFHWHGLTILDPFAADQQSPLESLLAA